MPCSLLIKQEPSCRSMYKPLHCLAIPLQGMLGQRLEILLPERLRTVHTTHREHYFTAPRMRTMGADLPLYGRRQDGSEFPVDISLRPVLLDETLLTIAAIRDLSQQHRAEQERVQQATRLRLQEELINLAHDAILVRDPGSRITYWNTGAEDLYGWSQEEVLGRVTHSLLQTAFPISVATTADHLEREGYWEGELIHTRRDGSLLVVESRQALVCDGQGKPTAVLEINRDITRRRQLEQEKHATHAKTITHLQFLQQLLDALPSSVYLVAGEDARLLLTNRATHTLWGAEWPIGQPMQEFLASNGISVYTPQGRSLAHEEFATLRVLHGGEAVSHQQESIRRPDGSLLSVQVSAMTLETPIPTTVLEQGSETRAPSISPTAGEAVALVVHQDVSALKQAEYLKDEFITVAAHELRNPLAVLKGFAEMLLYQTARGKGANLADWQKEAIEEMDVATARLDKLTEDLLDVTRLQAGRLILSRKPTDLVAVARQMLTHAHMTTQRHTFTFQTQLSSLSVQVDRARIEQVLSNLLSNAVKYSPQGGPIEVTLREEDEPHRALLSVRDEGIGIPTGQQGRIFGRFVPRRMPGPLRSAEQGWGSISVANLWSYTEATSRSSPPRGEAPPSSSRSLSPDHTEPTPLGSRQLQSALYSPHKTLKQQIEQPPGICARIPGGGHKLLQNVLLVGPHRSVIRWRHPACARRVWLASSIRFPRVPAVIQAAGDRVRQIPFRCLTSLVFCQE
jgi:PAS domain S-box-containing protein